MNNKQDKNNPSQKTDEQEQSTENIKKDRVYTATKYCMLIASILLIVWFANDIAESYSEAVDPLILTYNTVIFFFYLIIFGALAVMIYRYVKYHPNFGELETVFTLGMERLRKNLALKNAHQIFPALQYFLYIVLRRNRDILGIDPGPDFHALSPNGKGAACRNHTVYYTYELVALASPGIDINTLKQILNQLITAEVNNYGIVNLPSQFVSPFNGRVYQSVYLDRLTYDEVRHVLIFEMLFVGSRPAASALEKAVERDRPKPPPSIPDIFDDEV